MYYQFDVEEAKKYGAEEAIILNNIRFWIMKNKSCDKHFYDGRYWTYNSVKAFEDLFPFWSIKQIRRILQSLIEQGVLITGNFNKSSYDRTLWYAINDDEALAQMPNANCEKENLIFPNKKIDFPIWENENAQMGEPIPDINTDNKPDNKTHSFYEKENAKTDLFLNHYSESFKKAYENEYGSKPYLQKQDYEKIFELGLTMPDFIEDLPKTMSKLKALNFSDIAFKPTASWLLKDNNYARLMNGEFDDKTATQFSATEALRRIEERKKARERLEQALEGAEYYEQG